MAADAATPVIESVRAAVDSLPFERWITIRTRFEGPMTAAAESLPEPLVEGSFAAGTQRVPRDMVAALHKDEAVLPPGEARAWRGLKERLGMVHGLAAGARGMKETAAPAYTVNINNLTVAQVGGGLTEISRETVRKKLAPEIARYVRRSGRAGGLTEGGA